jgi:hypothetical protein
MTDDAAARLEEDKLYAHVHEEIRSGKVDTAAQARAMEEGGNDNGLVQQAYIKHRIARIKAEIEIFNQQEAIERTEAERIRQDEENEQMIYIKLKKKLEKEFNDRLNAEIEEKRRANPPKTETSVFKQLTENIIPLLIFSFAILCYIFAFSYF